MDPFYRELEQALESAEGDIWTETVLEGEHRGEKRLLSAVPDEEITVPKSNPDVTGTDGTGDVYKRQEELIQSIQDYIEYYNNRRLQRKLHIMTPMAFHELTLKAA